jgi:hypothetical protein
MPNLYEFVDRKRVSFPFADAGLYATGIRSLWFGIVAFTPVAATLLMLQAIGVLDMGRISVVPNWGLPEARANHLLGMADTLFLTPVIETALMLIPIRLARRIGVGDSWVPVVSATLWALVHARSGNWFRLVTFWPFFLFSIQFMREEQLSVNRAWGAVTLSHALYNTFAAIAGAALRHF